MSLRRNLALGLAAVSAAFLLSPPSGHAQDAPPPQQQAPVVTDTHMNGSWSVRCYKATTAACEMTQVTVERGGNVKIASIAITYLAKSDSYIGRFGVPLGVAFDQGLGLEIGSFRATNLQYRICGRDGCYVIGMLPLPLIDAMKSPDSGKGAMDIVLVDNRKIQIPIILDGFSDGLDLLKKWTLEKTAASDKSAQKE